MSEEMLDEGGHHGNSRYGVKQECERGLSMAIVSRNIHDSVGMEKVDRVKAEVVEKVQEKGQSSEGNSIEPLGSNEDEMSSRLEDEGEEKE